MKLYYSPGACSLASHITLHETGNKFDLVKVDLSSGQYDNGKDYKQINPHGNVPALQLDNGEIVTEGVAIMQYLADQTPASNLAPANSTFERTRLHERLNYLTAELHKSFSPLFHEKAEAEITKAKLSVSNKLKYLDTLLAKREYLLGDNFSIADIYLFVIANWTNFTGMSLKDWPNVARHSKQVASRKSAQQAMKAEGLI